MNVVDIIVSNKIKKTLYEKQVILEVESRQFDIVQSAECLYLLKVNFKEKKLNID